MPPPRFAPPTDDAGHPDLLVLDALRAGEPVPAAVRAHIAWCNQCREALAAFHDFRDAVHQPTSAAVPGQIEAAILAMARQRASTVRRTRWRRRTATWAAAAVAVLAIAGALLRVPHKSQFDWFAATFGVREVAPRASNDVDGDGRITVLDAFAVARHAAAGNPDGVDTPPEADALLAMAVSLQRN